MTRPIQHEPHVPSSPSAAVGIVTICGGGNGAHVAAAYLASKGVRVQVLTRQPDRWAPTLELSTAGSSWAARGTVTGRLHRVSSHAQHVIPQSDVVLVAAPAHVHPLILEHVKPYLKKGVQLGTLFAQGGFDWAVHKALGEDRLASVDLVRTPQRQRVGCTCVCVCVSECVATTLTLELLVLWMLCHLLLRVGQLFGLQNIPWICKATEYGYVSVSSECCCCCRPTCWTIS